MDLSNCFSNCHLYSAAQSSVDHLPKDQAAVYAFYEALDFSNGTLIDQIDNYVTRHGRAVAMDKERWPFSLEVKFRGNPERFKGDGLRLAKDLDATNKPEVIQHLLFLSLLGEPLYIGKTEDVKTRFVAHHQNGFLFKMKEQFKRPPSEFIFFTFFCAETRVRLIESILIQTINPPFCDQKT